MKIRTLLATMTAATLLTGSLTAVAQSAGVLKIGIVEIGRLIQDSPQGQAAREALEDEFAPRRRELVAKQASIEAKGATLQKDMEVMGADERDNAQRTLANTQKEFMRSQNEFREDVEQRNNELLGKVQQELLAAIQTYATEEGFDIVLYEGIVHASNRVLITEPILERLRASAKR